MLPGTYLADVLPFRKCIVVDHTSNFEHSTVRHLPRWTPFIKFHSDAERVRGMVSKLVNDPFDHVIKEMVGN